MSSIDLEVKPASMLVLSGEALPVLTTVRNRSAQPVWTRSEMQPSRFVYRLDPQTANREAYVLSESRLLASLTGSPVKPEEVRDALEIPVGRSESRKEEIAAYSREPLEAGKYDLRAINVFSTGQVTSPPVPLEVVAPKIGALVSQCCPLSRTRSTAFAYQEQDGRLTILQRESQTGKPIHSVYFRREQMAKGSSPQLALAVKLGPTPAFGRWLAALNRGALDVLYCYGNTVPVRLDSLRIEHANARLLATGFETTGQVPVFLIASGAQIHGYQAQGKQLVRAWTFSLPMPLTDQYFVTARPGDPLSQVTLVLLDAKGSRTRAAGITYNVAAKKTGAPVPVADVEGRLAAADLTPLTGSDPAAVDQQLHLLTALDDRRQMAYYTMPLSGEASSAGPRRFAGPVAEVDHWSITSMMEARPVLARAGSRLLVSRSAGAGWNVLASAAAPLAHAMIGSEDGQNCFAEWLDPDRGFRIAQVLGREI
jgi:hypothetical protein